MYGIAHQMLGDWTKRLTGTASSGFDIDMDSFARERHEVLAARRKSGIATGQDAGALAKEENANSQQLKEDPKVKAEVG